ncbi:sigma-E processing peptidase SpoIIGA [Domibacillus indicus]|uniref:sigma-E processing peptidase SpoIIGA n=1 Tax=Domibacillus indicus TaxID=1437523 RepID=UPI00204008FA|nr:sigma-E processing peptidase SpoIIGA [Domibacillus indicus]MCM3787649.1 sigma-E processing peptidase SpoIIGA [Domibacillus indicus]
MAGYAEGIIFFNFAADALLLFVTGKLSGRTFRVPRLLVASLAGTIPVCIYLAAGPTGLLHKSLTVIMPVFMIRIAFQTTGIKSLVSMVLTFYFTVFLTGGILFGFQSMYRQYADAGKWSLIFFFIVSVAISFYFIQRRLLGLNASRRVISQTVPVSFTLCGINWSGHGLIDTGNALCDPISKKEVAVCQIQPSEEWPEALFKEDISDLLHLPDTWTEKLVWVPSKSIHAESRLLASFRTDSFTICINGKKQETNRALVTFTDKMLSDDGAFACILHPNMVRE